VLIRSNHPHEKSNILNGMERQMNFRGSLIVAVPKSSAGGGARTAYGDAFAANGHKLPGKKSK
jgi:hypothetical protein